MRFSSYCFCAERLDKSVLQSAMIDVTFPTRIENNLIFQENVKLYPTLAYDIIMIKSALDIQKIGMYNQLGQLVKVKNINDNALNLNITDLNSGVCFVKVFSQRSLMTKSFVIE